MSRSPARSSLDAMAGRFAGTAPKPQGLARWTAAAPTQLRFYLLALGLVALSTLLAFLVEPYTSAEDEAMIYLLGDTLAALRFDPKVSIFTAVASIVAYDFFFIAPRMTLAWTDARRPLTFLAMLVVTAVVSGLKLGATHERTQLAHAMRRAELDAETERMRCSLLSAVSHDLRTPLAGIVASGTTLLEHEGSLDAQASRGLVSTIVGEGERLGQLLQNLLAMSRLGSSTLRLRKTPEAVEDIVSAALGRVSDALATRKLKVDVPPDLPWVEAEPALIEQVLLNLLENALRYTPPAASIQVAAVAGDGVVMLQISDSGPGIAEAEREQVFEQFFRGSQSNKRDGGVGLGLSICRAVVRAHGGSIGIREREGGGTLVEFTLPTSPQRGLPPSRSEERA